MQRKRPISLMIFILSLAFLGSYHVYYYVQNSINERKVDSYLVNNKVSDDYVIKNNQEEYLGIIEIPKINLKQGFYSINSNKNNVNKNIQLIKGSIMPNEKNSLLVLASHRGNSYVSFFNNLDKLALDDDIYIYYHNIKYTYIVDKIYEEEKDGTIEVNKNVHDNILILTTCSKKKNKQLIISAKYLQK